MATPPPAPAPVETSEERRRGELRQGVIYPIFVALFLMFVTGLFGVLDMRQQVKTLKDNNDDLKKQIAAIERKAEKDREKLQAERDKNENALKRLDDKVNQVDKTVTGINVTLQNINKNMGDMKDDLKDIGKKVDRLERKG